MATLLEDLLIERLTCALPKELRFTVHHLQTPPTLCCPIFSPAPERVPEETNCESHFLSISVDVDGTQIQAFAVEVLVYTTKTLTTLFVSKADSTGYLHLLKLPKGTASPIKTVISTLLELLVEAKKREGVRLVLSLFARAQDQYLFPGSIENSRKHVLDDRGLIRWWCRILNEVLRAYPIEPVSARSLNILDSGDRFSSRGYLRVPGCDVYETKAFFPRNVDQGSPSAPRWLPLDPLRTLGKPSNVPERCLIPRFPDDPKARFVIDLDDELPENGSLVEDSPSKSRQPGKWRSVRSLEEFWEMMAFRQECAAGRLVGFIWGVFTPAPLVDRPFDVIKDVVEDNDASPAPDIEGEPLLPTPIQSQINRKTLIRPQSPIGSWSPTPNLPLSPPRSSQLQPPGAQPDSTASLSRQLANIDPVPTLVRKQPSITNKSRSAITLSEPVYTRMTSVLQDLDYTSQSIAANSTRQWIAAGAKEAGVEEWGIEVTGTKELPSYIGYSGVETPTISTLCQGLVRRKKRSGEEREEVVNGTEVKEGVKMLGAGLVRKKPKLQASTADH